MSIPIVNDNGNVQLKTFSALIQNDFTTYQEVLEHVLNADIDETTPSGESTNSEAVKQLYSDDNVPYEYTRFSQSDTSVGGNDVINPYWQFNDDDDIIHPLNSVGMPDEDTGEAPGGMGRVYSETFDQHQQILWLSFGVPKFNNLIDFYQNSFDNDVAESAHSGMVTKLGNILGQGIGLAFQLPILPLKIANSLTVGLLDETVTEYCSFRPCMFQYYKIANSLMAHLGVSMQLVPNKDINDSGVVVDDSLPRMVQNGFDLFRILNKRAFRLSKMDDMGITSEELAETFDSASGDYADENDFITSTMKSFSSAARSTHIFIGFRVEKTTESSESLSTTTSPSSAASNLKAKSQDAADKKFSLAGGNIGIAGVDTAIKLTDAFVKGALSTFNMDGIAAAIKGSGFFSIPDKWDDSEFTKSYSFTMKLRSPSGSKTDIFQSIYVPYCLFMAGAFPRSTGANSYTSPFYVQAFCKGMFGVRYGIIKNATVTRGRAEHGWSYDNLPTAVDISFDIADLSPGMNLSLGGGLKSYIFGHNENLQEYMNTLAGLGLVERYFLLDKLKRRAKVAFTIARNTTFNPLAIGASIGNFPVCRAVANLIPGTKMSNR